MMLQVLLDHISSVICPTVAQKYPLAQKCLAQYRFFRCGNSSNSLFAVRPLIRLMISLGAISGGLLTSMCTWSLLTTPRTIRISNASHVCLTSSRMRSATSPTVPCSGTSSPTQSGTQSEKPYDFRICSPSAAPPMPHLEAKADRLKASGLNLVMESQAGEVRCVGDMQFGDRPFHGG